MRIHSTESAVTWALTGNYSYNVITSYTFITCLRGKTFSFVSSSLTWLRGAASVGDPRAVFFFRGCGREG